MPSLHFSVSSNIKDLLGRNLVTDQYNAILELVKNSYDADAKKVDIIIKDDYIVIEDDGTGMTLDDIDKKWMRIGTSNKKQLETSQEFNRPITGDKGIGRFSSDRLGNKLILIAQHKDSDKAIEATFNWDLFTVTSDNEKDIKDINIAYKEVAKTKKSGVRLEICGLRDSWDESSVSKLYAVLQTLQSPLIKENNIDLIITAKDFGFNKKKVEAIELRDLSELWVEAEITKGSTKKPNGEIIVYLTTPFGTKKEIFPNKYTFGPIKTVLYYFSMSTKLKFQHRMKKRVVDFGNIHLYRDAFRIYPYGEEKNDWLGLGRRKQQGAFRYLGTRDLVGFVQISRSDNHSFIPLASRQGLEENKAFSELQDFLIKFCVGKLENSVFQPKPPKEQFSHSVNAEDTSIKEIRSIVKDLSKDPETKDAANKIKEQLSVIQARKKEQVDYVKKQEETLEVLSSLAQKEVLLSKILHDLSQKVTLIQKKVDRLVKMLNKAGIKDSILEKAEEILTSSEQTSVYMLETKKMLVAKKKIVEFDLIKLIHETIKNHEDTFKENNITCTNNIKSTFKLSIQADKTDFERVFENILSNAIKALKQINGKRRIEINQTQGQNKKVVFISVKDNGIGIPAERRSEIFMPFITTTDGMGLGLSISKQLMQSYGGDILLGEYKEIGAEFIVKLPLK